MKTDPAITHPALPVLKNQIEILCWDTQDAVTARPTRVPYPILEKLAGRLTSEVPGVVSVTFNIATKPPSTLEVV